MTDQPYNGSTVLVKKIEHLLGEKKISTPVVMRLLLELKLDEIKKQHELHERVVKIEEASWSLWAAKNPKTAMALFILFCSFIISDLRQPVLEWVFNNLKVFFSLL